MFWGHSERIHVEKVKKEDRKPRVGISSLWHGTESCIFHQEEKVKEGTNC